MVSEEETSKEVESSDESIGEVIKESAVVYD